MKRYLFGLGAMLVGAGLMFVLMHGEVSADNKDKGKRLFMQDLIKKEGEKDNPITSKELAKHASDLTITPEPFVCSYSTYLPLEGGSTHHLTITHCKTKNLDCGYDYETGNMTCVKG